MLKKILAWFGAVVFGVNALVAVTTQFDGASGDTNRWPFIIITGGIAAWCVLWLYRNSGMARSKKLDRMQAAAEQWIEAYNAKALPPVDTFGVMVPRGERALLAERSQLAEVTSRRKSSFAGTRISVGGLPLYFGGSDSVTRKEMRVTDTGTAVLTDKSLIFAGELRTFSMDLADIVNVSASIDAITLSTKRRATPLVVGVANPILWSSIIRSVASA